VAGVQILSLALPGARIRTEFDLAHAVGRLTQIGMTNAIESAAKASAIVVGNIELCSLHRFVVMV